MSADVGGARADFWSFDLEHTALDGYVVPFHKREFFFGPTFDFDFSATPGQSAKAWAGMLQRTRTLTIQS